MTDAELKTKLSEGKEIVVSYADIGYVPSDDDTKLNEIIELARNVTFGVTNDVSEQRLMSGKRWLEGEVSSADHTITSSLVAG